MATRTWEGHVLAGWWSRALATIVDTLLSFCAFGVLFGIAAALQAAGAPPALYIPFSASGLLSLWLLPSIRMAITNGQSPGKKAARIRVVRTNGKPATVPWSVLREWPVKALLLVTVVLDQLWPLWDRENRALHDMVVGSRVVSIDAPGGQDPLPESTSGQLR